MATRKLTGEALALALKEPTGHLFRDHVRLRRALTHASARGSTGADYERLEFLGDRVLGLVIAELLFKAFPAASEGRAFAAAERAGECRDAGRNRRRDRPAAAYPCRRRNPIDGGPQARQSARRRAGVADRRALSRRRPGNRQALHPALLGAALEGAERRRGAIPRPNCRNGRIRPPAHVPAYTLEGREGPDHDPLFTSASRSTATSRRPASAAPNAKPSRRPRRQCCFAKACGAGRRGRMTKRNSRGHHPVGLRRPDRRAECRQVDAGQPAGRRQGVDRHPQGADDARHRARHRHPQQRADRLRRHARHLQAAAPAGHGDGDDRLGRRQGCRRRDAADRRRARHQGRRRSDSRPAEGCAPAEDAGPQQGRPGEARSAAGAGRDRERARRRSSAPSWSRR